MAIKMVSAGSQYAEATRTEPKKRKAGRQKFPPGWDEKRVRKVLEHYENQSEDQAVAEDEAAYQADGQTVMIVPTKLVPAIRQLLGRRAG